MIFSPSIDAVFRQTNRSIEEKLGMLHELGFSAFEIWGWWNRDLDALQQAKERHGLTLASMCTRIISLVDPSQRNAYLEGLKESLAVAQRLGCRYLISQTGNYIPEVPREQQQQSLIAGLKAAAPYLEEAADVTLIVEPLNTKFDHKGYYLERSDEAFEIIDAVGSPQVKIVYYIYHQQISEGNLIPTIKSNMDKIAYFHLADHPGRHEPGTGEIHYPNVLQAIRDTGYTGYVGLEYFPLTDARQSLQRFLEQFAG
ncbi:hydroxypyruvate isomerase family protein [Paenibacillus cremeus]|uniref:TIM barrel protein n=1 Tax=Paenibacillus cremeus TaxID=2163881 RepID=A0A559K4B9_9BACL|nr:TIM barrel protein [Paenibacillus cremeus]TVY06940.1 TIM barrel protein [Paenibacillus cremeus]